MPDINKDHSDAKFDAITAGKTDEIVEIATSLRALIADVMPGVVEVCWGTQQIAGYGIGPKKMSEHFCYIAPMKAHVNLGFMYGADLNDPKKIMEGSGKALRHIKIRSLDQTRDPDIRKLIEAASKHLPKAK